MILSPKLLNFQLILIGRLCILILSCRIGSLFLLLFMVKLYSWHSNDNIGLVGQTELYRGSCEECHEEINPRDG